MVLPSRGRIPTSLAALSNFVFQIWDLMLRIFNFGVLSAKFVAFGFAAHGQTYIAALCHGSPTCPLPL